MEEKHSNPAPLDESWELITRFRHHVSKLRTEKKLSLRNAVGGAILLELLRPESDHWKNPASPQASQKVLKRTVTMIAKHLPVELISGGFLTSRPSQDHGEEAGSFIRNWVTTREGGETIIAALSTLGDIDYVLLKKSIQNAFFHLKPAKKSGPLKLRSIEDEATIEEAKSILYAHGILGILRLKEDKTYDLNDYAVQNVLQKHVNELCEPLGIDKEAEQAGDKPEAHLTPAHIKEALSGMNEWVKRMGPIAEAIYKGFQRRSEGNTEETDKAIMAKNNITRHSFEKTRTAIEKELKRRIEEASS